MNLRKALLVYLCILSATVSFAQQGKYLIFGKGNKYYSQFNDVEKKVDKAIYAAYISILPPDLEIPINKYFESDSCVSFIGVSFKYTVSQLADSLAGFGKDTISKKLTKDYFLQQVKIGNNTVNRVAFYSSKDNLTYLINLIFIRQSITIDEFESIIKKYLKK